MSHYSYWYQIYKNYYMLLKCRAQWQAMLRVDIRYVNMIKYWLNVVHGSKSLYIVILDMYEL